MNKQINSHVSHHQVASEINVALFVFVPKEHSKDGTKLLKGLIHSARNPYSTSHKEAIGVYSTTWKVDESALFAAIQSLPRHFKENTRTLLHVIFFCHGIEGHLCWDKQTNFPIADILNALKNLEFKQLDAVSLLSCNTLKNVTIPRLPFNLIGFKDFVYWNDMPFFTAKLINEYSSGCKLKKAVELARKSCDHNDKKPFPSSIVVFRSKANRNKIK